MHSHFCVMPYLWLANVPIHVEISDILKQNFIQLGTLSHFWRITLYMIFLLFVSANVSIEYL